MIRISGSPRLSLNQRTVGTASKIFYGLLLTMGNALAHDVYFRGVRDKSSPSDPMVRVLLSKFALLMLALAAAYVAAQKPANILALVSASFSLAAAAFFPAMVAGLFWQRTTRRAAVAGMLTGLGVTLWYMLVNVPVLRAWMGWGGSGLWWGIQPISAGVFGLPAGALVVWLVSLLQPEPVPAPEPGL